MANKKFKIPVDSSLLTKAINALKNLGKASEDTKEEVTDLGATFEDVNGDAATLSTKLGELEDRMYALADAGKANSKEFRDLAAEAGRLKAVQQETDLVVDRLGKTFGQKLTGGVQTAVDAFTIAQVTMEALGIESEGTAALMEKLFIAQSVADSFSSLEESTGLVTKLGKAIKSTTLFQTASAAATKAVAAANWLWNAALTANPIGAIIVAVTALIAAGYALIKMFVASNQANKEAVRVNDELNATLDAQKEKADLIASSLEKETNNRLALARAQGKTKEELRALELQLINNQIAEAKNNKEIARATALEVQRQLQLAKSRGASKKNIEALEETLQKADESFQEADDAFLDLVAKRSETLFRFAVEDEAAKTKKREEGAAKRKQIAEKEAADEIAAAEKAAEEKKRLDQEALDAYKEIIAQTQDANEDYLQRKAEGEAYEYEEARRNAKQSLDDRLEDLQNALDRGVISEAEFTAAKLALETDYNNQLATIQAEQDKAEDDKKKEELEKEKEHQQERLDVLKEFADKQLTEEEERRAKIDDEYAEDAAKLKESLENKLITTEEYNQLLIEAEQRKNDKIVKSEEDAAKDRAKTEQDLADAKLAAQLTFLNATGQVFNALTGLFEEGTAAAKIATLADIALGTATGFIQGLDIAQKGSKAAGPAAPFAFPIFYATQIAAVLGAAAKAKSALSKVPGGGSSNVSTSAPSIPSVTSAPTPPSLSLFGTPNESVNIGPSEQQAGSRQSGGVRAYVVESDITSTQNTLSRYRQRSEIG